MGRPPPAFLSVLLRYPDRFVPAIGFFDDRSGAVEWWENTPDGLARLESAPSGWYPFPPVRRFRTVVRRMPK